MITEKVIHYLGNGAQLLVLHPEFKNSPALQRAYDLMFEALTILRDVNNGKKAQEDKASELLHDDNAGQTG